MTDTVNDCDEKLGEENRKAASRSYADKIFGASQANANTQGKNKTMLEYFNEPAIYSKATSLSGRSYFKDLVDVATGRDTSGQAAERLRSHAQDVATSSAYAE